MNMDDLARYLSLERRLVEKLSTRVELFEHGVAYFDEEFRERFDSNFLMVDRPSGIVTAAALMAAADRILGGAGYRHREVLVRHDAAGGNMAGAFAAAGYVVDQNAIMVWCNTPDRRPGRGAAEVDFAEVRPLLVEVYRRSSATGGARLADSFADQHSKAARVIGARFFMARIEDTPAGSCELYMDGADAQIESVDTLEEFRGRGVATAVVLAALDAATAAGAERVFIIADDVDWPKQLYAKLGFTRVGRTWQFTRWP